jgi:Cd2+/Zn2+-exporting ATPase
MIYEYTLDGLHCSGCGERVVRDVKRLPFVSDAEINLATGRLRITAESPDADLLNTVQRIVGSTGHGVIAKAYNSAAKRLVLGRPSENSEQSADASDMGRRANAASEVSAANEGASALNNNGTVAAEVGEMLCERKNEKNETMKNENAEQSVTNGESAAAHEHNDGHVHAHDAENGGHLHEHSSAHEHGHGHSDAHEHEHSHEHDHGGSSSSFYITLALSLALFVAGFAVSTFVKGTLGETASAVLMVLSAVIAGWRTAIEGVRGLIHRDIDESLLMTVAVVAACAIGEFTEAAMVMILSFIGNRVESAAARRSRKSIEKLTEIRPDTARLADGSVVSADDVKVGDELIVRPFERVPVDCTVVSGASDIDASAITGESVPIAAAVGTALMSGMVNGEGLLHVTATAEADESAAARIIRLVENSTAAKGSSERFITRFAKIYTPVVIGVCVLVAVLPPLFGGSFSEWMYKALAILVASCPCALVISVPLAFFAGVGAASKKGVLIKGGKYVEKLAKVDAAAFDKTGTITDGTLTVENVYTVGGAERSNVLDAARIAEFNSAHPIARAAVAASDCAVPEGSYTELPARGIVYEGAQTIVCGSAALLQSRGIDTAELPECRIYVAVDGRLIGGMTFADRARDNAAQVMSELRSLGVDKLTLLTGDNADSAERTAAAVGINRVAAGLLPEDKVTRVAALREQSNGVVFVGDGINDAPVLAAADVGFAMGLGTDAAIEAADAVLTGDSLAALPDAIRISRKTMRAVRFNIAFPLAVKLAVMATALIYPIMWLAVAADVVVMMITVLNSARLVR